MLLFYFKGIQKKAQEIQKYNDSLHLLSRGGYELLEKKLMAEKRKIREEQAAFTEDPSLFLPSSPISRHEKWKSACTKQYGQMTSQAAKEIADKIDSLEEQSIQGSIVPSGRDDILNMAIGRPEHYGLLADIIGNLKEEWRREAEQENIKREEAWMRRVEEEKQCTMDTFKGQIQQAIKLELSQIASQHSAPLQPHDIQLLAARRRLHVTTENSNKLVAVGKQCDTFGTIHNMPYSDDVVRVSVVEVIVSDAEVPIPTSEIKFLKEALGSFVPWPTHLVKPMLPETVEEEKAAVVVDPLGELVKNLFEIYQRPVGVSWDGAKFGINNVKDGFFITHADVSEIILGDKCLNISILQLWLMAHLQLLVLCPGDNLVVWFCSLLKKPDASIKGVVNSAMKSVSKTAEGKPPQHGPQWIEAKSHVQTGNYECGYYVMHWIWCIVSAGLKDEWIHWFSD
ncbi:hypothetical protein GmHk_05G012969 [Glycine max]|nr:hypothetical protein GmHk_05G012969 [Glycine max]